MAYSSALEIYAYSCIFNTTLTGKRVEKPQRPASLASLYASLNMENKDLAIEEKELSNRYGVLQQAFHLAKIPIIISLFLTPVRFLLELAGLPEYAIFIFGLLWLTLAFSVYWGFKLYTEKKGYLLLLLSLLIFSPISRLTVVAAWWVDTKWEIGTHYGLYFDNWIQTLLNHGIYGALVQIIPGMLIGSMTIAIMRYRKSESRQTNNIEN